MYRLCVVVSSLRLGLVTFCLDNWFNLISSYTIIIYLSLQHRFSFLVLLGCTVHASIPNPSPTSLSTAEAVSSSRSLAHSVLLVFFRCHREGVFSLTYLVCHMIAGVRWAERIDDIPALDLQWHVEAEIIAVVIVALEGFFVLILNGNCGGDGGGGRGQIQRDQVVFWDRRRARKLRLGKRW